MLPVGLIVPWNVPLAMAVSKIAPALAAGCTVVLKPAELSPLTALRMGELTVAVGFPPGVVNIVTGLGTEAGQALVAHPGVDKVSFTGSTAVGKAILASAAGNLKRVALELGGKSPVFIFPDADLDRAIDAAARGIFSNEGAEEPQHHEYAVHVRKPLCRSRFPVDDEEQRGIQASEHADPRGGEEGRAHTPSRGEVGHCLRRGVRHGAPPTAAWSSPLHPTRCPRGQSLTRGRGRSPRG